MEKSTLNPFNVTQKHFLFFEIHSIVRNSEVELMTFVEYIVRLCDIILWSFSAKMYQSRLSLLISH